MTSETIAPALRFELEFRHALPLLGFIILNDMLMSGWSSVLYLISQVIAVMVSKCFNRLGVAPEMAEMQVWGGSLEQILSRSRS